MLTQLLPHALLGAAVAPTTHSCRAVLFGVQHSVHIPAPGRGAVDWAHFLEHVLKARSHLCAMWTNARIRESCPPRGASHAPSYPLDADKTPSASSTGYAGHD